MQDRNYFIRVPWNMGTAGELGRHIEAIKNKPEAAKAVFRSETELVDDVR